jgi:Outer membrane protein beta-barrel domain
MRKLILVVGMLLALPLVSLAQDAPKVEIFGGYSYLNPDDADDLHGWNASVSGNVNKWFGIKSDFSGHYDRYDLARGDRLSVSTHFFLAGGQFTYRGSDKIQPFAHLMAGTVLYHAKARTANTVTTLNDTGFALAAGGGVDVKIAKALAVRLIQADYIYVRDEGLNIHNFRLSTGLVVRLGDQ